MGGAKHAAFLAFCLVVTGATYLSVNHAKFGTWLNPAPLHYHVQYDAERLAKIGGKLEHLSNIPFCARVYFGPGQMELRKSFPWFAFTLESPGPGSGAKLDVLEGHSSIPAAMPALAVLSLLGVFFTAKRGLQLRRRALPIVAAAFLAGCLLLTVGSVTYRYVHDFYPFLIVSAVLGAGAVQSISPKSIRLAISAMIAVAGIWSIAANFGLALRWQREDFWPAPRPRAAFLRMRQQVDSLFIGKSGPLRYNVGDELGYFQKGQLLTVVDPPATYRYDGARWLYVDGAPLHLFSLLVEFPRVESGTHMALWSAGPVGANDAVYVVFFSSTSITFCSDHWGSGGVCGSPVEIQPGSQYHLRIDADRLNSKLTVTLNGGNVLEHHLEFHKWKGPDVLIGKSLAPAAHGGAFTGKLRLEPASK